MNIVHEDDREFRDDELHTALRAEYGAPADGTYWSFLERRIMARIRTEAGREWWSYFPAWSRAGRSCPGFGPPLPPAVRAKTICTPVFVEVFSRKELKWTRTLGHLFRGAS